MELEDVKAYHSRLESELSSMLSQRKGIVEQIEIERKELAGLIGERTRVGTEIAEALKEERKKVDEIRKEKDDFLTGLSVREEFLEESEKELVKKQTILDEGFRGLTNKELYLRHLDDVLRDSQEEIIELKEYLVKEKQQIDSVLKETESRFHTADILQKTAEDKLRQLTQKENALQKKEINLSLKEEESSKDREMLAKEREEIAKDRLHLFSQQQALKSAFDEARRKNLL